MGAGLPVTCGGNRKCAGSPRILSELAEMREQTRHIPQIRADVTELQHAMAATRADIATIKDTVEDIKETSRLMEGRLFRLEKHAGFAKA